ncbi:ROK family protein [Microvirga tunisiensis]|uniref:ROK family protein n=2 Tax=Pannonibacter tanglangensis TaxID=2750084 RepID=A0ABW9ZFM4_9HYPH|nr:MULTISPECIES: ROK family transcriptional regulator [unclassified Pannonibacter]NBN63483.1 ROK family protein [Pannonibacter sp. XCT-34]NBN77120.1 ROK family protein [Pannonibacter sp. XCT-53]
MTRSEGGRGAGAGTGRGSNSAQLRRYNERIVLQILRRAGEASKADLARAANLTNAAIGAIIQELARDGLIEEVGKRHDGGRGQPATMLRLAARGAFGFGVRLGRAGIETVLVDFSGRVIGRSAHDMILPVPDKAIDIIRRDIESLHELLSPVERRRITGIGLAQPFNLGAWLRELGLPAENFKPWDEVDVAAALEKATRLPVFAENDGTAAAVAELFYGLGRHEDDFLYLFIGPAIGGGLILHGDVVRGRTGNAADVAVMPVQPSRLASAPRPAGAWDILLTRASLGALARHLTPGTGLRPSRSDLEQAIATGRVEVEEWLDDCIDALTPSVRASHALLDVPLVVVDCDVDGGLLQRLLARLQADLEASAPEARSAPRVERGSFGQDAGALGAASLPMFFNFSPRAAILTGGNGSTAANGMIRTEEPLHT